MVHGRRAAACAGRTRAAVSVETDIAPLDEAAMAAARQRLDRLTKPVGSLGRLERLVEQLAGITGSATPRIEGPAVVVFAGDHGVTARGVSAYPSDVTAQMVANFVNGGAAINVLARAAGAELVVVDVGVAGPDVLPSGGTRLVQARVRSGTRDMTVEPAMTPDEAVAAIGVGRDVVRGLIAGGCDVIALGEMGIGNTTAASALVAALTDRAPAEVTGRGAGLDGDAVRRKVGVIEAAIERHRPSPENPVGALAAIGGLEIAALVGAMLAAGEARVPVVLDGFITGAAALVAVGIAPSLGPRLIASHRSTEPGHRVVLEQLGLEPLLDLELRLGEGSGAALALPLLRAGTLLLAEMATFDSAGVSGPSEAR
jgi:nicotinate-nucleotide--dimethylbenzimidazole phosphoribosyltransferase